MVALEKYSETTNKFLAAVRENKQDLCMSDGMMYHYEEGAWAVVTRATQDKLDRLMKEVCDESNFPYAEKAQQLWRNIKPMLPVVDPEIWDKAGLIALPKGRTFNPVDQSETAHDPEHYIQRRLAFGYDPKAKCPRWHKMLDRMVQDKEDPETREEIKTYLQCFFGMAIVGYRFETSRAMRKMLILDGPTGTAKTTVSEVLRVLLGKGRVATDNVDQLSSRFGMSSVVGALAIISDDAVGEKTRIRADVFKQLITGEPMTADRKGRDLVSFRFHGPILFTANQLPAVSDATAAFHDRTTVITLTYQFTPEDQAETLEGYRTPVELLTAKKEFPGILQWALQGLHKVKEMGRMPSVKEAIESSKEWRTRDDAVYNFLTEYCRHKTGVANYPLPLAAAIAVFAETQYGSREYTTTRVSNTLGRTIHITIPGVTRGKRQLWKQQLRCYNNIEILEPGLKYVAMARERGLLPNDFQVNERNLGDEPPSSVVSLRKSPPSSKSARRSLS